MDDSKFLTYAVIEFNPKCSDEIKQWLKNKLEASKSSNGAEFVTKYTKSLKNEVLIFETYCERCVREAYRCRAVFYV